MQYLSIGEYNENVNNREHIFRDQLQNLKSPKYNKRELYTVCKTSIQGRPFK